MAGNENIFVEFDYQNIIVVDPNKIVDDDGNAKERLVNHEDLVIYANLECSLIPRSKLVIGIGNSEIQTTSLAKINFLKPTNKEFLNNNYTEIFTGKSTKGPQISNNPETNVEETNDDEVVESSLLGIKSINFRMNSSFMPTISMVLEDVRGKALFELGDNSPYAAFFNLPYPSFFLTLKGFYGKAVRYQLMLQNFNARFDNQSGNFVIDLTFLTYKFTVLSEVSMGYLLATPYMYNNIVTKKNNTGNPDVKDSNVVPQNITLGYQKIKEMYGEYKAKGIIAENLPEYTLTQLQKKLDTFIKEVLLSWGQENMAPITNLETYSETLLNYNKEFNTYTDSVFNKYIDKLNPYILNSTDPKNPGQKVYLVKPEYRDKLDEVRSAFINEILKNNTILDKNPVCGVGGKYKISGTEYDGEIKNRFNIGGLNKKDTGALPEWLNIDVVYGDIDIKKTFQAQYKKNYDAKENTADAIKFSGDVAILFATDASENSKTPTEPNKPKPRPQFYKIDGNNSFLSLFADMQKDLKLKRTEIYDKLSAALNDLLKNGSNNKAGLGFAPTMRNVLAILFANGEAFLRLMDDVHSEAWNKRDSEVRKKAILGTSGPSSDKPMLSKNNNFVYPWPQFIVETEKEGIKSYDVTYPGDINAISLTEGYLYDEWPEIEFVEELLTGLLNKNDNFNGNPDDKELTAIDRISLNSVEYPLTDQVYDNKEEVKFFYELWERMGFTTNYSRLTRGNPDLHSITDLIADTEATNIVNSLGETNVFLIKKLKEYDITPGNIRSILRSISNNGEGVSYQRYIRGLYSTPYITALSESDFKIYDNPIFDKLNGAGQNTNVLPKVENLQNYLSSSNSNEFQFVDTFPFNNLNWAKNNLSNGNSISDVKLLNRTDRVINYNTNLNVITNYSNDDKTFYIKRPLTYFNYLKSQNTPNIINGSITTTQLKDFYLNRTTLGQNPISEQLPTEGLIKYQNYDNNLLDVQTTSMLNTPYFINAIQEGVSKFRNYTENPYVSAAYLFLNSLPLSTLKETYKTYETNETKELDYLFATFKKYGSVHKLPYAWVLKYGSIWHRYKKQVETNTDILDNVWQNMNFLENYDPVTSADTKVYVFTGSGDTNETRIILQANDIIGNYTASTINVGFYPKIINDFSVFYNGYRTFVSGYTSQDIQAGINLGLSVFNTSTITAPFEFDPLNTGRTLTLKSYSVTLNDTIDANFFLMPSVGNNFNQTLHECFNNIESTTANPKLKNEPTNNPSMFNGSVRTFWISPNYGWFNNSQLIKPTFSQYFKKILTTTGKQNNFELNGNASGYTYCDEILPTFKREILDQFEDLFLKFCNSKYDFQPIDIKSSTGLTNNATAIFQNFQLLFTEMMKIPIGEKSKDTNKLKASQYNIFRSVMQSFLEYDILFNYGNPSEYNKNTLLSFTNASSKSLGYDSVINPYKTQSYNLYTPFALPTSTNPFPLSGTITNYPDAWKALITYVGFSDIPGIAYSNLGSTVFDFFIDNDIEFTEINIKNLYPLIKIYATQKKENGSYSKYNFQSDILNYVNQNNNFQNLVLQSTMTKLRSKLPNVNISPQQGVSSILTGAQGKVELWESLKATNDRWIAGFDLKYKTIFEDVLLYDRASRDIGDKIIVDIIELNKLLTNINVQSNLLSYVQSILQMNHFQVMSLPSFVNFYNVQDPIKNAIPKIENSLEFANDMFGTFTSVDYRNSGPKMVCFYSDKPSEHLNQNTSNYPYNDDGIYFNKLDTNTLSDNLINKTNWAQSNRVVGFTVDMGIQNQNMFTNISVSQDVGKPTSESMKQLYDMANQAGGKKVSTQNNSLYNLYKTRSYGCTVETMGNAMIQPMMYFNLRHIPMFSGSYMILTVNHTITPGNFTTQFSGVRQSVFSLPNPDNYLQSIITALLDNVFNLVKQEKAKSESNSQNTPQDKQNQQLNQGQISNSDSCSANTQFNAFEKITNPSVTKKNYGEMLNVLTGVTSNLKIGRNPINNSTKDKVNYIIWAWMYLNGSKIGGFESYENNFIGLTLDLKIKNKEVKLPQQLVDSHMGKKYFCSINNSMATFDNPSKCLNFISENIVGKMSKFKPEIKNNNGELNNSKVIAKEIYKFLFINWPNGDLGEAEYNKIKGNEVTPGYEDKIDLGINEAFKLRL